uniref:neuritin-like n=1 Tax=Myxine glutinosa TaxID=7769 RepID=UPI00358E87E6
MMLEHARPTNPSGRPGRMALAAPALFAFVLLAVRFVDSVEVVNAQLGSVASESKCSTFFPGFSNCLRRLGQMVSLVREDEDEQQAVTTICRHWEEFQSCAVNAMSDCHKEATENWRSLERDMRKLKFKGNMYTLCDQEKGSALWCRPHVLLLVSGLILALLLARP